MSKTIYTCIVILMFLNLQCFCTTDEGDKNMKYTTKYDSIDLDEILKNDRLLTGYVKCLLDEGPCTPDGKELKNNLPDAIENNCGKCTEKQMDGSRRVMEYIIDNRPDDWKKLEDMYNPSGEYKRKYIENKNDNKDVTSHP